MRRIFLAAGYPAGTRGELVRPYSIPDIDRACVAVAEAVLQRGWILRFGGHPTITPQVMHVADLLGAGSRVEIFQSRHFESRFVDEIRELIAADDARVTTVDAVPDDEPGSLWRMRELMLAEPVEASFFLGGMEGLRAELEALRQLQPRAPRFFFHAPGGMARVLSEDPTEAATGGSVLLGRAYTMLTLEALDELAGS